MPENKFRVKGTDIQHDGKLYPEGSEIVLSEEDAKRLQAYIEKTEADKAETKGGKSK
jgi:hypothetical protein